MGRLIQRAGAQRFEERLGLGLRKDFYREHCRSPGGHWSDHQRSKSVGGHGGAQAFLFDCTLSKTETRRLTSLVASYSRIGIVSPYPATLVI
jgi:hypothetical protein